MEKNSFNPVPYREPSSLPSGTFFQDFVPAHDLAVRRLDLQLRCPPGVVARFDIDTAAWVCKQCGYSYHAKVQYCASCVKNAEEKRHEDR